MNDNIFKHDSKMTPKGSDIPAKGNALEREFANAEIEKAWLDEADRRWKEIEDGKVRCLPADEVMEKAKRVLREDHGKTIVSKKNQTEPAQT